MKRLLMPALRQYRHNNSDEFVMAYEKEETEAIVSRLVAANRRLKGIMENAILSVCENCLELGMDAPSLVAVITSIVAKNLGYIEEEP